MNIRCLGRRAALLCGLLSVLCSSALPQTAWRRDVELSANGSVVRRVAADDTRFVAVGRHGLVMTSTDGADWIERDAGTWEGLIDVRHLLGHFVAVGEAGSLFVSADGIDWTQHLGGLGSSAMAADGERLVLIGHHERAPGSLFVSTNLTQWTPVELGESLHTVIYFNGRFLLTAENTPLSYSSDGFTWQPATWDETGAPAAVGAIATVGDVAMLSAGSTGNQTFYRSTDGMTWSAVAPGFTPVSFAALGDRFIAHEVGSNGTNPLWESADGLTWTLSDLTNLPIESVQVGEVEVERVFSRRRVGDGPWEPLSRFQGYGHIFPFASLNTIATGNGVWLTAFGARSTDGVTWEPLTTGPWADPSVDGGFFRSVSFAGGRFFVLTGDVGDSPTHLRSTLEGETFTDVSSFTGTFLPRVIYANDVWLTAARDDRRVLRSTDGINWTEVVDNLPLSAGTTAEGHTAARHLAATDAEFLLLIEGDGLYRSADGLTWLRSALDNDPTGTFVDIAWQDGRYFAASPSHVFTSEDGWNWAAFAPPLTSIQRIGFAADHLVAIGRDGISNGLSFIATSPDGGQWSRSAQPVDGLRNDVRAIASDGTRTFIAVGDNVFYSVHDEGPTAYGPERDNQWSVLENQSPLLTVAATSTTPLTYQWSRHGIKLPGATSSTFNTSAGPATNGATLPLVVKVSDGTWTSAVAYYGQVYSSEPPAVTDLEGLRVSYSAGGGTAVPYVALDARFTGPLLSYEWRRDGQPLGNSTAYPGSQLIPLNAFNEGHRFQVIAHNAAGSVASREVTLDWPDLETVPIDVLEIDNQIWQLNASTTGATHYQWRLNGEPLPGATQSTLQPLGRSGVETAQPLPSGFIDVLVFNARETLRSATFRYQLADDPPLPEETPVYPFAPQQPPQLSNLSVRGAVGSGEAVLVAGQVIKSPGLTVLDRPTRILTRAVGPGLASFGIADAVTDPALRLHDAAGNELAANDDWAEYPVDLAPVFDQVGAFDLSPDSRDAALMHAFAPAAGSIASTASVSAADGSTDADALIESYRLPDGNGSGFANYSARGRVTPGQPVTLGFVIEGDGVLPLLLRALGPALTDYGISDPAPAPQLRLYNAAGESIAIAPPEYPPWIGPTERIVGAAPVAPYTSNGLIRIDLPAGVYSAQATDAVGGIVLLELFQLTEPSFNIPVEPPIDVMPVVVP